jgi:hypothetical protein
MMKRVLVFLVLPLLVGAGSFVVTRTDAIPRIEAWWRGDPAIDLPEVIDVGECEQWKVVTGRFRVANRGGRVLEIRDVRTDCGCSGVERESGEGRVRVAALDLPPGASEELLIRWQVRGEPGSASRTQVHFRTNDPRHPEVRVDLIASSVTGGAFSVPATVVIGPVIAGDRSTQVVDIRDRAKPPRRIENVTNSLPERVTVRLLPIPREKAVDPLGGGQLIARVEVSNQSQSPGSLQGELTVFASGQPEPLLRIPFLGDVLPEVQLTPSILVLPRRSASGDVFRGSCLCRSARGIPFHLEAETVPEELAVRIEAVEQNPGVKRIEVEWKPSTPLRSPGGAREIRFRARLGTQTFSLKLDVNCRSLPSHG